MKVTQKLLIGYFRTKLRLLSVISTRRAASSAFDLFCTPLRRSNPRTPAIFFQAEPVSFQSNGNTIRGFRWKRAGAKKVLIIHGFESSCKKFDRYVSALVDKSYEVVAFDAPAHGNSGGRRINLPSYLTTLKEIHQRYGPFDGYVAHSFGGLAVAHLLENVSHDNSTRLVLIAPATETVTTIDSFFAFLRIPARVRPAFDRLIEDISGRTPGYFSVRRAVQQMQAKVLWFHDEDDELTPVADALAVRADGHAHVTFRISRGLGHRRIYRDPEVVKEVVGFL